MNEEVDKLFPCTLKEGINFVVYDYRLIIMIKGNWWERMNE